MLLCCYNKVTIRSRIVTFAWKFAGVANDLWVLAGPMPMHLFFALWAPSASHRPVYISYFVFELGDFKLEVENKKPVLYMQANGQFS